MAEVLGLFTYGHGPRQRSTNCNWSHHSGHIELEELEEEQETLLCGMSHARKNSSTSCRRRGSYGSAAVRQSDAVERILQRRDRRLPREHPPGEAGLVRRRIRDVEKGSGVRRQSAHQAATRWIGRSSLRTLGFATVLRRSRRFHLGVAQDE